MEQSVTQDESGARSALLATISDLLAAAFRERQAQAVAVAAFSDDGRVPGAPPFASQVPKAAEPETSPFALIFG